MRESKGSRPINLSFSSLIFAKALLKTTLERAGDEDSGDEEEMAKEEDQNAFSVRIIGALNTRKSVLTTH
ncbi:hypothetical protein D8674_019463 [Pyrus ussuriensis x Pyrus communis]|uniref:Uncharacterized protein n=1 Tax=Pyrus ussuriensis x Pyrus communis TaxID=2448454 RepID=A0A5N5GCF9_9ROSA|nr:hypothetical protein D8674_019463 [Pyrus ussuriensis x Pyrus communis]